MKSFLFLSGFQWFAVTLLLLTMMLLADALAGHFRSGFHFKVQFSPFAFGGLLILLLVGAIISPHSKTVVYLLQMAGWLCAAVGVIGLLFHYQNGIGRGPRGYTWWLHHFMYGPPLLAPLGLSAAGLFAVLLVEDAGNMILLLVAVSLLGAVIQTFFLHYRGAFNNPLMYLPFTFPVVSAIFLLLVVFFSQPWVVWITEMLLWLTFLTGFIGLGMHLRGLDRQRGGLNVPLFNLLEGPPAFAPGLYAGFASIGLVDLYLL